MRLKLNRDNDIYIYIYNLSQFIRRKREKAPTIAEGLPSMLGEAITFNSPKRPAK